MFRQFSKRRIIGFFLLDWVGTLALLLPAGALGARFRDLLPTWSISFPALHGLVGREALALHEFVPGEVLVLVGLIWPCVFFASGVYDGRRNGTLRAELLLVFLSVCVSAVMLAGALYLSYRETLRVVFALFVGLDLLLLSGSRAVVWSYRRYRNGHQPSRRPRALIVGAGMVGRNVVRQIQKYAWANIELAGFVDDDAGKQGQPVDGLPVLGTLDQAADIVAGYQIEHAIAALPLEAHDRLVETCQTLQGLAVRVYVVPDLFALSFPNAALDGFGGIPVIDLGRPGLDGGRRIVKRVFDLVIVLAGLCLIWPLLALIAILIKLDSPGPVIYKQTRIGENGRRYAMFKFRSMREDADPRLHQAHVTRLIEQNVRPGEPGGPATLKMDGDPRVTRVGKFIRKTSLDELPQVFNVLRGEMSLVGPRPPIPYEVDLYQDWHTRRLEALPGMTGLWQVQGRNRVSFDEMVRMDLEYIRRQSLWLDIKILLQTPLAAIAGRGAG